MRCGFETPSAVEVGPTGAYIEWEQSPAAKKKTPPCPTYRDVISYFGQSPSELNCPWNLPPRHPTRRRTAEPAKSSGPVPGSGINLLLTDGSYRRVCWVRRETPGEIAGQATALYILCGRVQLPIGESSGRVGWGSPPLELNLAHIPLTRVMVGGQVRLSVYPNICRAG